MFSVHTLYYGSDKGLFLSGYFKGHSAFIRRSPGLDGMKVIIAIIRLLMWAVETFVCTTLLILMKLTFTYTMPRGMAVRHWWASMYTWTFGFKVEWAGELPSNGTYLFASNHRSSVDPFIQLSGIHAEPVSRADLGNWPLIGWGARLSSIILVDKSNKKSRLKAKTAILDALRGGRSVLIYPEGGTKVSTLTETFHIGSFLQAAEARVPVIPVLIDYKYKADYWDHADSALVHMVKRFGKWKTPVYIKIGPPISSENGWTLMRQSKAWIDGEIPMSRQRWNLASEGV